MDGITDPMVIGVIGAPHGVHGTVRVKPTGDGRHLRQGIEPLVGDRRRRIRAVRPTPKGFLVDLEDINSRGETDSLRGAEMVLDRAELDAPEEDEIYVADLIGMKVLDEDGRTLGTVAETFETLAHEVLVVRDEEDGGSRELYVPFTLEHVPDVDSGSGRLMVRLPEED